MAPQSRKLLDRLSEFVSEHKLQRFDDVLSERTRHLTVVLEDLYQAHNASACLRSCECFGVQDVHVIENRNRFRVSRDIVLGAAQWLTLHRYTEDEHNTRRCLESLRKQGYRVIAASPRETGTRLDDYDVRQKTALLFGTEMDGLSEVARECADGFLCIPTVGFTESLNISVSVAVCLHHLTCQLRRADVDWQLREEERLELKTAWVRRVVEKHWRPLAERIVRECSENANA